MAHTTANQPGFRHAVRDLLHLMVDGKRNGCLVIGSLEFDLKIMIPVPFNYSTLFLYINQFRPRAERQQPTGTINGIGFK